jgi:hypothetical protein
LLQWRDKTVPGHADLEQWDAWSVEALAGFELFVVAAGWAIDLFLGGEYREHERKRCARRCVDLPP